MCRTDTLSFALPARRSTEPEVFTFDPIPETLAQPAQCARPPRRRVVRVLYPSTGRRYLPRAERSPAKRWLLALCLVVLLQIYSEDDVTAEAVVGGEDVDLDLDVAGVARYDVLPFVSAEEEMKAATETASACSRSHTRSSSSSSSSSNVWSRRMHVQTCPKSCASRSWDVQEEAQARVRARARNGGYVVALLYPVYHKLGSEQ